MNIQWYPGHMTKAKRMMEESIKLIDVVIELVDARIPRASTNPDIDKLAQGKLRLILLNKADLANSDSNKGWIEYYKQKGIIALEVNSKSGVGIKEIVKSLDILCKDKRERDRRRGIINRPIRAMVVGIPNVGKSTLINSLCKKASAKTGNKPGVTKGKQWIRLNKELELLDTPGILWPKFEDKVTGEMLAYIGSIKDELIIVEELVIGLINIILKVNPNAIKDRYGIDTEYINGGNAMLIMDAIAIKRGCLKSGGVPDIIKAASIFIEDYRSGKLGRITLEEADSNEES